MAIWRVMRCNPWSNGGVDYAVKDVAANSKTTKKTSVGVM